MALYINVNVHSFLKHHIYTMVFYGAISKRNGIVKMSKQ